MRTRQFTRTAAARAAAVVVLAVAVAGCAPGGEAPDPVEDERAERIDEVVRARGRLAETVPAVVEAADGYVSGLRGVRATEVASADERAEAAAALPTTALDAAEADLAAVELDGDGPDVEAARAAVAELLDGVDAVRAGVAAEVDEIGELAAFDAELAELVGTWDRPGSRSEQREALDEAATRTERLARRAEQATPTVPCLDVWTHRAQAAATVAERSAELRDLVGGGTGLAFDEARDAWRDDPTGLGAPPAELDAEAMDCWDEGSDAPAAVEHLRELAAAVEAALSPDDLTG